MSKVEKSLIWATVILLIATAVITFVSPMVASIDTTGMGGWQLQIVVVVQYFFQVTPWALVAGFGWSLFGFLRYKLGDTTVQYEINRVYETWMWFEGLLLVIGAGLPLPLATTITGIIMAVKSVINALRTPPPLPTTIATPMATGPPSPS